MWYILKWHIVSWKLFVCVRLVVLWLDVYHIFHIMSLNTEISFGLYRKNYKIWDTSNNCHNCPKNRKVWCNIALMHPKDADGMANSVNPIKLLLQKQSDLGLHCLLRPIVWPEIIENFYQISASIFLASYYTILTCCWYIHHSTTIWWLWYLYVIYMAWIISPLINQPHNMSKITK